MIKESRLYGRWDDDELILVIGMYFLRDNRDSHGYDEIARWLGRYNPATRSYRDGAINQKLAEISGYDKRGREPRHAGEKLMRLVDRYRADPEELRKAATRARNHISARSDQPIPPSISTLLG